MNAIIVRNLCKSYGSNFPNRKSAYFALKNLNMEVDEGVLYALLGPNGSGKTTLIRILAGLMPATSGEAKIDSVSVRRHSALVGKIGVLLAGGQGLLSFLTGYENLEFFASLQGMGRPHARKRIAILEEILDLHDFLPKKVGAYSSGMRQRLLIARSMLHDPKVLLLDEPIVHLDPIASRQLHKVLKETIVTRLKKTVFITTHQLEEAQEIADRVGLLFNGELLWEKTVDSIRSGDSNLLEEYVSTLSDQHKIRKITGHC